MLQPLKKKRLYEEIVDQILQLIHSGELKPGDDVLFLVVAGDIREHVKATFSELLDRIKAEAVIKQEFTE